MPHVTGAHGDAPKIYDFTEEDDKFEKVRESIVQWLDLRLKGTTEVTSKGRQYIVPNSKYFDLGSKVL